MSIEGETGMSHSHGESHEMANGALPNHPDLCPDSVPEYGEVPSPLWASVSLAVNGGGAALPASQILKTHNTGYVLTRKC